MQEIIKRNDSLRIFINLVNPSLAMLIALGSPVKKEWKPKVSPAFKVNNELTSFLDWTLTYPSAIIYKEQSSNI